MFKLGELGVLSPQMEKLGLLGPTDKSKRRPGTYHLPIGDMVVVSPLWRLFALWQIPTSIKKSPVKFTLSARNTRGMMPDLSDRTMTLSPWSSIPSVQ
jgi:hypothetical protein